MTTGPVSAAAKSTAVSCPRSVEANPSVNRLDPASRMATRSGRWLIEYTSRPYPSRYSSSQVTRRESSAVGAAHAMILSRRT